jgi:peptidoglycan/xylan/chitin deacetylase (PgdA/CDA1 family)
VAAVLLLGAGIRTAIQSRSVLAVPAVEQGAPVASLDPAAGLPEPAASDAPSPEPSAPAVDSAPVLPETQIPMLMYHEIAAGPNNLYVPPAELAAHLEYLKQNGYSPITLQQAYDNFTQGRKLPPHPIVLTFDDGYVSFYTNAWPLLKQHKAPGTLFVITGFVGKPGYVTWEQVKAMAGAGIEMGAHTVTHPDLRLVKGEQLQREVAESRRVLQEQSGQPVASFAYPAGKYNDQTLAAVKEAGYTIAVTTEPGAVTPCQASLEWKRIRINKGVTVQALASLLQRAETDAAREGACQVSVGPR